MAILKFVKIYDYGCEICDNIIIMLLFKSGRMVDKNLKAPAVLKYFAIPVLKFHLKETVRLNASTVMKVC